MMAAYVVDKSAHDPRILLVQRAFGDSKPGLWETPGGRTDPEDPTVLHGLARELREEAGMKAKRVGPLVNQYSFRAGRRVFTKCNFLVEVTEHGRGEVTLDPKEHRAYVWATEAEVRRKTAGKADGRRVDLKFTSREQEETILKAFEVLNTGFVSGDG